LNILISHPLYPHFSLKNTEHPSASISLDQRTRPLYFLAEQITLHFLTFP
jgi:hypothetical protein